MTELAIILLSVIAYITVVFVVAWSLKRLDIVDIAWGGGFIVAALVSFFMGQQGTLQLLVTGMVIIWGARLAYSIFRRTLAAHGEDPRYTELRKTWKGNAAVNAYFRIFLTQGILATIVSAAVIIVNLSATTDISLIVIIGLVIWIVGFVFESVGDAQLKKHLADPSKKGTLMTTGLWAYSRHPNYFGEATQWWGIYLIALSVPFGWTAIISPLVITYLLLFVSGVPPTEKRFTGRPGWDEYKKRTSVFIPLPPK